MSKKTQEEYKTEFMDVLKESAASLNKYVSSEDGQWTIKGFIDLYKNIYTISSDTKIISKILEIHIFPKLLELAEKHGFVMVLAEHQNWYPDISFLKQDDENVRFAVDLKTTYRDPNYPNHVNGFTLGSHGEYFRNRKSTKNIQYPYGSYLGHFCLGIIYSRADDRDLDETEVVQVQELKDSSQSVPVERRVTSVSNLKSIASVISDFQFFVCEKWQLASDRPGSGNTANIGSITYIPDILRGNGVFAKLGEKWFDEYWMNFGIATMRKDEKVIAIKRIEDFVTFKGGNKELIVKKEPKRKKARDVEE